MGTVTPPKPWDDFDRFTVTEEHLKLLRHAVIRWQGDEFGAPEVDPKRPYGNSSVYPDIAEILGIQPDGDDYEPFSEALRERMDKAHRGTEKALQIAVRTGSFEAGDYIAPRYSRDWKKAE
jgi:hypothetical protein